ncbi:MAG: T9SS type A sorting domain-containing protein [Fulvivirga sp.]
MKRITHTLLHVTDLVDGRFRNLIFHKRFWSDRPLNVIMLTMLIALLSASTIKAQNVTIPDANFKAYLVGNSSINTNADTEIQVSEAQAFTGVINCKDLGIADLTGLEAFTSLTQLICGGNPSLTSMDVSQNTALFSINVTNASLTALDVSNNTALQYLQCSSNQLTSLDLSQNTALLELNCGNNSITSLDLSNNTSLEHLRCYTNQLTALDVSQNTQLTQLFFYGNQISAIDVTNNTALQYLYTFDNPISTLDVSNNTSLINLYSHESQLTSLDVSQNPNLVQLTCYNNQLMQLNVANGNNVNLTAFDATDNPNLSCIQVDDAAYSTTNWTDIDAGASFSEDCAEAWTPVNIPDANFKAALLANPSINTIDDGEISFEEAKAFTGTMNVSNESISDLTGIEAFTNITNLICSFNSLTSLDVSSNLSLESLTARNNQLTELDVSQLSSLEDFDVANNLISAIDVSNNAALKYFFCNGNELTSIDISQNSALQEFGCENNQITSLDFSANSSLTYVWANANQLTEVNAANGINDLFEDFDFRNNPNLTCITVDDVAYAEANFTDVDATANFSTNCNNTANDITAFSFAEQAIGAIIDAADHTVVIDVVSGTDMSALTPTFTVSSGATADPASGVAQDFSSAFVYTITAENPTAVQEWTITVREENSAPTGITLGNSTIDENNSIDDVIGEFTTTDADESDMHTYTLISGTGDSDNASFGISENSLIAKEVFDFETKSSYSIRVQTDDGRGGLFEKEFTLSINDLEERVAQTITFNAIENQFFEAGSLTLSATASSGLEVSYDVVSGPATVSGNIISFSDLGTVVVSASQAGNEEFLPAESKEQSFEVIAVTGLEDEASALLIYPNPAMDMITVQTPQENITLKLLNIRGSEVMNITPNVSNDISQLDKGIYFLKISSTRGTKTHKIIKN